MLLKPALIFAFLWTVSVSAQNLNDHMFPAAHAARPFIDYDSKGFLVNGHRTFIVSAGLEYARIPHQLWRDRLMRLKRAGFNCIEIYTFWNFHEPREGQFEFSGDHDLNAFLRLVKALDLYAIVRVGPYYCAEWDQGGYPLWLRFKPGVRVREPNAPFQRYVGRFFDHLIPIVAANQINHGGAVILVQLENEHPQGWGTVMPNAYFRFLKEKSVSLGLQVPYFFSGLHHGSDPAADWRPKDTPDLDDPGRPNPWITTEFWSVWYDQYGSTQKDADIYEHRTWEIIAHGGNGYNYYMAHGGSNFGYTNNDEDAASYDYGAAVGQGGDLRPMYYSFKRTAWFARSFQDLLENSSPVPDTNLPPHVSARTGPAGVIYFVDNTTDKPMTTHIGLDTVIVNPGEMFPFVERFDLAPRLELSHCNARIYAIQPQGKQITMVIYGDPGSSFHFDINHRRIEGRITADGHPDMKAVAPGLRLLTMSHTWTDRTWFIKTYIVCGPRYAGDLDVVQGKLKLETESPLSDSTYNEVQLFGNTGHFNLAPAPFQPALPTDTIINREQILSLATLPDKTGLHSIFPQQMGADGDLSADAWYGTTINATSAGPYTLLVEGSGRGVVIQGGHPGGPVNLKEGTISLYLHAGLNRLLIFSAHDGRDKLVSYLGPIDSVDRKGLFGRALLVKGQLPVTSLTGWQMLKVSGMAALSGGPPPADIAGWQPYTIGTDAFARHEGYGWFRVRLQDPPTGVRQICLHFGSVDEDATVFIGNRRIMRHEGWNRPFSVTIDGVDTLQKPLYLTLFIENRSNEGGIDKSVTVYPLVDPVPVTGWTLQGGPGKYNDALLNSLDSSKPARATMLAETGFRLPVFFNSPWLVWRVIPKGLGHGSVWVNGHNLGRYPEKIPINGLYVPSCWLKVGENDLRIFDEDGNVGNEVYIGLEKSASRKMITYIQP